MPELSSSGESSSASSSSSDEVFDSAQIIPQTEAPPPTLTQSEPEPANPVLHSGSIDPSFLLPANPSTSALSNNSIFQDSQPGLVTNTQSSESLPADNGSQHVLKSTHPTAPTRAWIGQRVAKAIHIDEDNLNTIAEPDPFQSNLSQNPAPTSSSSQRIIELGVVEEQLAQLLSLASDVLGSLNPAADNDQSATDQAIENFSTSIGEYFELLNKIQLGLRTSMSHLRVARISTRILFEPVHVRVPNCPVGLGNVRLSKTPLPSGSGADSHPAPEQDDGLSLGSLIAERNAWKDFVNALESVRPADPSLPLA